MTTLENRFLQFLSSWPGAEKIDDIVPSGSFTSKKRADFLLFSRSIVVELKTLKTDTSPKIDKELEKHQDRNDYPLIYGPVELQKILRHLPDHEEINRRIYRNITRSIEDSIRSAEIQIRDTKEILNLPDAIGLVVLLNEGIEVLSPDIAVRKVSEILCRSRSDGSIGTPISFAWCLFESHVTESEGHPSAFPCVLLEGPNAESHSWFDPLISNLLDGWAQFNNATLVHSNVEKITELSYRSAQPKEAKDPSQLTRQEYWEQRYSANPYLRGVSAKL